MAPDPRPPTDADAERELAHELALYLPLRDPQACTRMLAEMRAALRQRRQDAGLP